MKPADKQFLGLTAEFTDFDSASIVVLPFPYEGGVSYGRGAAAAPDAVLAASEQLELYDEVLDSEPYRTGISTVAPPEIPGDAGAAQDILHGLTTELLALDKFVAVIGGDHSISSAYCRALMEKFGSISVVQLDAHADLRDSYDDSRFSHACSMARIRELTEDTVQIGIRSMSVEEADLVDDKGMRLYTMYDYRGGSVDLDEALEHLPDPVFVTVDVDVFDWSVIRSTGTPEPGGFTWDEGMSILFQVFAQRRVVGLDIVELAARDDDVNSAFATAKLLYKMLGFKLASHVRKTGIEWPESPSGMVIH